MAVVLCQNHRVKQLVHLTHHHGSTQVPKESLYRGDLWELSRPRKLALAILSTQDNLALPKGLALPYSYDEILSGYEGDVPSIRDGFSALVKADPETNSQASRRRCDRILSRFPRGTRQKTRAIFSGIPFLRRRAQPTDRTEKGQRLHLEPWTSTWKKKEPSKGILRGKWHIITFLEATEYHEHDFLTNRFHVTHYGGRNKDTFFSDTKVSSIYLHDTTACEQDKIIFHGSVSAHQQQLHQKAWNREEASPRRPHHNAGRGDFNATAGRQSNGNTPQPTSIIEEAFADTDFPMPHSCGAQEQRQVNGPMCVVLSSPRTLVTNGRFVCMELSQFPARASRHPAQGGGRLTSERRQYSVVRDTTTNGVAAPCDAGHCRSRRRLRVQWLPSARDQDAWLAHCCCQP